MRVYQSALSLLLLVPSHCLTTRGLGTKGSKGGKKTYDDSKDAYKTTKGDDDTTVQSDIAHVFGNHVAIANRGAGTISLVDPDTLETAIEYTLPDGGEPMYFALSQSKSEIWVGDRANNRMVILKMMGDTLELDGFVYTPAGLFHSMITQANVEYPIVVTSCDIDNVIVVHDLTTRRLLATLKRPQDAADAGAKPHDVTTNAHYIFVTFLGTQDGAGYIASYDAFTFELIAVLETVADPHVAIRDETHLFVAAQGGEVLKVSVPDLEVVKSWHRPTPHGMFISNDSKYLYTTNIAQGGEMAVDVWDVDSGKRMDCPAVTTSYPVPHNPTLSMDGSRIFITHSGATSHVNSAFEIGNDACVNPKSEMTFETNLNPFGLFVVPPAEPVCLN